MKKTVKMGRHSAPTSTTGAAVLTGFAATAAGVAFSSVLPAAIASETEAAPAADRFEVANLAETNSFTVTVGEDSAYEVSSVEVTSEEPVVEEPVVEEPVQAAPVEETAPAAEETLAEQQAAPAVAQEAPAQQAAPAEQQTAQAEPAPEPAPVASNSSRGAQIVAIARQYAGAPYVWGGTTPAGWDCIGFARYVYAQVGVNIPASSSGARYAGTVIPASQAQPGDLMWWPGHVGIYTGGGMHIAAWNPSMGTQEAPVWGNPIYIRVP